MQSAEPKADHAGPGTQPAACGSSVSVQTGSVPQHELISNQVPLGMSDHENPATHPGDDQDQDNAAWTQISSPSNDEMSVSDDAPLYDTTQFQTPKAIIDAEKDNLHEWSDSHTFQDIHERYTSFSTLLCQETATEDAGPHIQDGLPVAVDTAQTTLLDEPSTLDEDHDVYAFALVIHVWQIVCYRMEHGSLPSADIEDSLCLNMGTYFLSAHVLVENYCTVSSEELRFAVQYWEYRLKLMGQGNQWMEDPWTKAVQQVDQERAVHRNDTADRYLEFLEKFGKEGLAISIIEQETKGDQTQLRTMIEHSPDGMRSLRREMNPMLYSMDTSLLRAMIQGQLPRLAEIRSGPVYETIKHLNEQDFIQAGMYMNCMCDFVGLSPTPHQWQRVCEQMLKYVQVGGEHNDLAQQIDQQLHPKPEWPKDLAHRGLRRYTEWRSYLENGDHNPEVNRRRWVKCFVDQLRQRMEGQPVHAPLTVPVVEIGFSNDPRKRLQQHRHHESSNYLMNLAEAIFDMEYPSAFQLQQNILFGEKTQSEAASSLSQHKLNTKEEELKAHKQLIVDRDIVIHDLKTRLSLAEAQVVEETSILNARISTLHSELCAKNNELHSQKLAVAAKDEKIQELEVANAGFGCAQEKAQRDKNSFQIELGDANRRAGKFEAELSDCRQRLSVTDKKSEQLRQSLEDVRQNLSMGVEEATQKSVSLKKDLVIADGRIQTLSTDLEEKTECLNQEKAKAGSLIRTMNSGRVFQGLLGEKPVLIQAFIFRAEHKALFIIEESPHGRTMWNDSLDKCTVELVHFRWRLRLGPGSNERLEKSVELRIHYANSPDLQDWLLGPEYMAADGQDS